MGLRVAHTGVFGDLLTGKTSTAHSGAVAGLAEVTAHDAQVGHVFTAPLDTATGAGTTLLVRVHHIAVLALELTFGTRSELSVFGWDGARVSMLKLIIT